MVVVERVDSGQSSKHVLPLLCHRWCTTTELRYCTGCEAGGQMQALCVQISIYRTQTSGGKIVYALYR